MTFEEELDFIVLQTNREHRMLKTRGLAQKLALLKHNMEAQADKLGKRVDDAAIKSTETFAKSHAFLDSAHSDIAEIEEFISEVDAVTNGGPALKAESPNMAIDPDHTTRDSTGALVHK
jgi:hypothetical protein